MNRLASCLLTGALGPVLLLQAAAVRRRIPRLPEARGPRRGQSGEGPPLSVLVVGDSAAAGVGVPHQDRALLGRILAGLTGTFRVTWTLVAWTGATTASVLDELYARDSEPFDVAVTSIGLNDATHGLTQSAWRIQHAELRGLLRTRFHVRHTVVSGLPPIHRFPGLPQPLRWFLGTRAERFNRGLQEDITNDETCSFVDIDVAVPTSAMARDGFHPGPTIYATWGAQVADRIHAAFH